MNNQYKQKYLKNIKDLSPWSNGFDDLKDDQNFQFNQSKELEITDLFITRKTKEQKINDLLIPRIKSKKTSHSFFKYNNTAQLIRQRMITIDVPVQIDKQYNQQNSLFQMNSTKHNKSGQQTNQMNQSTILKKLELYPFQMNQSTIHNKSDQQINKQTRLFQMNQSTILKNQGIETIIYKNFLLNKKTQTKFIYPKITSINCNLDLIDKIRGRERETFNFQKMNIAIKYKNLQSEKQKDDTSLICQNQFHQKNEKFFSSKNYSQIKKDYMSLSPNPPINVTKKDQLCLNLKYILIKKAFQSNNLNNDLQYDCLNTSVNQLINILKKEKGTNLTHQTKINLLKKASYLINNDFFYNGQLIKNPILVHNQKYINDSAKRIQYLHKIQIKKLNNL